MLRIATFNLGMAGIDLFGFRLRDGVPHAAARIAALVDGLTAQDPKPDVWLLQEVYGKAALGAVTAVPGYRTFLAQARPRLHVTGLAILVRQDWPSELLGKVHFGALDRVEKAIANKGGMAVGVESPLGPVAIGNLHTCYDGKGDPEARKKAPVLRRRQVEKACAFMEKHRAGAPALLGGDFNFSLYGEPGNHAILTDRGWRDLRETAARHDDAGIRTWSGSNPLVTVDPDYPDQDIDLIFATGDPGWTGHTSHILTGNGVTLDDGTRIPLSDHYGLLAEVTA